MSLNTNQSQNTNKEKKSLKLAPAFEQNQSQQSYGQPYFPQQYSQPQFYSQYNYNNNYFDYQNQQYTQQTAYHQITSNIKHQNNQHYQHDKQPNQLQDIQLQQQQIQSQPQKPQQLSTIPKEKKKLKLTKQEFKVDQTVEQKLEEKRKQDEELKKKEEELKQKEEEERKKKECLPKSYTKQEIEEFLEGFDAAKFNIFNEDCWKVLAERKYDSINQIAYRSYNKKESTRPLQSPQLDKKFSKGQESKKAVEFNRGTDAKADQATTKEPKIIVIRQVEDISVKQRKEKMKSQVNWLDDQKTEDTIKVWEKEVKFKLNQLAPDNFQQITKIIIDKLIEQKDQAVYLAERIIEKSQLEPKYRYLYTSLCSLLVQDARLQEQNQKNPQKKSSIFKKSLLLRVQQIFEQRNKTGEKNQEQTQEQKEYEHMLRKNKIMGNVRFIGDLYQQNILPQQAVVGAITELLAEYLSTYTPNQENEEENIEGLVELLDQIGPKYKEIPQTQAQNDFVTSLFNGQQIPKKQVEAKFQEIFTKGIPQDIMFLILELLKNNYKLTQMVEIKIVNLIDRRQQGWKEIIHQKGESAKGSNQLRQEFDEEKQSQSYQSGRQNNKRNTQTQNQSQVVYVAKQSQQTAQERDFDEAEFKEYIKGTFKLDSMEQTDRLKEEIKRYADFQKGQLILFTQFFQIMLKPKQTNVSRAQIVFELLCLKEANDVAIKEALQSILKNEDFLFDLIESPKGKELFVDIIACFLNEEDLDSLKKFYIKPPEDLEDYINFLGNVMSDLESKFSDKDRSIIDLLNQYLMAIQLDQIQIQ